MQNSWHEKDLALLLKQFATAVLQIVVKSYLSSCDHFFDSGPETKLPEIKLPEKKRHFNNRLGSIVILCGPPYH